MYQIDNSTAIGTQPASTAPGTAGWFTDGSPGVQPATIVPAEWLNAVQAELCNLVTEAGQTLTKNKFSQVAQAIQSGKLSYGSDSGTANAYVVELQLPLASLFTGLAIAFQATHTNTGASTLNVSGLGASPIYGSAHAALQGGEIVAGGFVEVTWNASLNGGSGAWVLLEQTGGATQVAPATQSNHAMQLGQATGRLLNIQTFNTAGTFTYTPSSGTTRIKVRVLGAGGAGGGCPATSSGQIALAGAGNAGSYAESFITSGFSGVTITIGAGGVGASNATGGNGGTSSFGSFVSCIGGNGGNAGAATSFTASTPPRTATNASGGNIINVPSPISPFGLAGIISGNAFGGAAVGANGMFGASNAGAAASGFGAAGAGFFSPGSTAASAGYNGAPGMVIVEEYA